MHNQTHQNDDRLSVRKPQLESAGPQQAGLQTVTPANAANISRLPGRGGAQLRRAAMTQMQRTQGNAFVQRFLNHDSEAVQRFGRPDLDQGASGAGGGAAAGAGASSGGSAAGSGANSSASQGPMATPTTIGDGSASLTAAGGVINGQAAMVDINTAMLQVPGVLKASTLIVDNVIASSYTPGAGNVW